MPQSERQVDAKPAAAPAVLCCSLSLNTNLRHHFSTTENGRTKCNTCSQSFKCCCTTLRLHMQQQHPSFELVDIMKIVQEQPVSKTESPIATSSPKSTKKRSSIWNHFTKTKRGLASCDVCKVVLSIRGGQLNLWKHLRIQHPLYLRRINDFVRRDSAKDATEDEKQTERPLSIRTPRAYNDSMFEPDRKSTPTTVKLEAEFVDFIDFPDLANDDDDDDDDEPLAKNDTMANESDASEEDRPNTVKTPTPSIFDECDGSSDDYKPDADADHSSDSDDDDDDNNGTDEPKNRRHTRDHFTFPTPHLAKCKGCQATLSFKYQGTGNLLKHLKSELHIRRSAEGTAAPKRKDPPVYSKPSKVWKYFTKLHGHMVTCNLCGSKLRGPASSNLSKHLRSIHKMHFVNGQEVHAAADVVARIVKNKAKISRQNSVVRRYFTKLDGFMVSCNVCKAQLCGKTSSAMNKHLQYVHQLFNLNGQPARPAQNHLNDRRRSTVDDEDDIPLALIGDAKIKVNANDTNRAALTKHGQKYSTIWLHFRQIKSNRFECLACHRVLSITGGASSNLHKHLRAKHPELAEPKDASESLQPNSTDEQSPVSDEAMAEFIDGNDDDDDDPAATDAPMEVETTDADASLADAAKNSSDNTNEGDGDGVMHKSTTKASVVWLHFELQTDKKAICKLCHQLLSALGGTSNLFKHLRSRHPEVAESVQIMTGERVAQKKAEKKIKMAQELVDDTKTPSVWNHFDLTGEGVAKCNACGALVHCVDGKRANLRKHMHDEHKDIVEALRRKHLGATNVSKGKTVPSGNLSGMWRYFTRISDIQVECDVCNAQLEHSGTSTFELLKHMNAKHYELRGNWQPKRETATSSRTPLARPKLSMTVRKLGVSRPRSVLWTCFVAKSNQRAECRTCNKVLSAGSTSNLWKHLCAKHLDIASKLCDAGDGAVNGKNDTAVDDDEQMAAENVGAEEFVTAEEDVQANESVDAESNAASKIIVEYMDEHWKFDIPVEPSI